MSKLKFKHKIVISGNHEITLDDSCMNPKKKQRYLDEFKCNVIKKIFSYQKSKF